MSEMLNSLLPGHEQAVKTARDKLRASTLWLLADRTWHSWVDLKLFLTLCVKEEDALAQYALWEAGQASPSRENMLLEEREGYGGSLLVSSAIDSLVTDGLCQVRGEGWARQIQRVRLDASSRSQVRAMQEAYVKALHTAQGWLDAGRPIHPDGLTWKVLPFIDPQLDHYAAFPVAAKVAAWLLDQAHRARDVGVGSGDASPAPLQGAENGNPNPACTDAPLPATPGHGPKAVDKLFWFNAGFFHETRQRFFLAREANEPTRIACKALVVGVLAGAVKPPPVGVLDDEPAAAAKWIRTHVQDLLTEDMYCSGAEALWRWGEQVGLPRVRKKNSPEDAEHWGVWVHQLIHWEWIARKLREELERHKDRAGNRALELACGQFYEHVEMKLGGFVGPLGEMFLRFTQAR